MHGISQVLLKLPLPPKAAKKATAKPKPKANGRVAGPAGSAAEAAGWAAAAAEAADGDAPASGTATVPLVQRRRLLAASRGVRYAYRDAPDGCSLYSSVLLPAVPFLSGGA
jgi:predicted Zn-dependent protease